MLIATIAATLLWVAVPADGQAEKAGRVDQILETPNFERARASEARFDFVFEKATWLDVFQAVGTMTRIDFYVSPRTARRKVDFALAKARVIEILRHVLVRLSRHAVAELRDEAVWLIDVEGREPTDGYWCLGPTCPADRSPSHRKR